MDFIIKNTFPLFIIFLYIATTAHLTGFYGLPLESNTLIFFTSLLLYFFTSLLLIKIPILQIIHCKFMNKKPFNKVITSLLTGSLICYLTLPPDLALYFNFIVWLKWPIIIILFSSKILIVIFSIKSIWKNRAIKTDPRISILQEDRFANEHLKRIGLMVAYEPASWFYFFPAFSKKLKPLGRIKNSGGSIFFCVSLMILTVTLSLLSYRLISPYDQFIAAGISGVTLYFLVSVWANFRCTRYHSLAECNGKIIVNNGFYDFCFFEKKAVDSIELSTTGPC